VQVCAAGLCKADTSGLESEQEGREPRVGVRQFNDWISDGEAGKAERRETRGKFDSIVSHHHTYAYSLDLL
jgi:predicted phage gp36 major capsid-like protein